MAELLFFCICELLQPWQVLHSLVLFLAVFFPANLSIIMPDTIARENMAIISMAKYSHPIRLMARENITGLNTGTMMRKVIIVLRRIWRPSIMPWAIGTAAQEQMGNIAAKVPAPIMLFGSFSLPLDISFMTYPAIKHPIMNQGIIVWRLMRIHSKNMASLSTALGWGVPQNQQFRFR